jgi:hypothetical protein
LCDFDNCENIKELFPKIYNDIYLEEKKEWEERIKTDLKELEKNKDKKECKYNKKYWYVLNNDCFDKKRYEKLKKEKFE